MSSGPEQRGLVHSASPDIPAQHTHSSAHPQAGASATPGLSVYGCPQSTASHYHVNRSYLSTP